MVERACKSGTEKWCIYLEFSTTLGELTTNKTTKTQTFKLQAGDFFRWNFVRSDLVTELHCLCILKGMNRYFLMRALACKWLLAGVKLLWKAPVPRRVPHCDQKAVGWILFLCFWVLLVISVYSLVPRMCVMLCKAVRWSPYPMEHRVAVLMQNCHAFAVRFTHVKSTSKGF